mmetsp:Transcript_4105/g.6468  ORF Transcript_4105/g.6468 Transcript_4105/m.6468 type:complete len:169 (+) Transcript_4105:153-659(+)
MDSLSKEQKDEFATSFAILALYDGGAEITSEQITTLLEATGNNEVEPFYPVIFASYLSDPENVAKLIACPAGGGGGGGGGGMSSLNCCVVWICIPDFVLINFLLCCSQAAVAAQALVLKKKRKKRRRKKRKPTLVEEWTCSEVTMVVTTKLGNHHSLQIVRRIPLDFS